MKLLGIESSCDDTSVCIARVEKSGRFVIDSLVVQSQDEVHEKYGGIVPELAARNHIQNVLPCLSEALNRSKSTLDEISAVCVTQGPGLIGSLLIGTTAAQAIAYFFKKPLVCVDHIHAHLFSALIEKSLPFPFLGLVISGGHTSMYVVDDFFKFKKIGETQDDAAGEALDKAAKMLGLGYPGGRAIDEMAAKAESKKVAFPIGLKERGNLDFSYSGLKTALYVYLQKNQVTERELPDLCASYQDAVVQAIIYKIRQASEASEFKAISIAGGVACNSQLRRELAKLGAELKVETATPSPKLCTDNAAMVAFYGWKKLEAGMVADPFESEAYAWNIKT